MEKNNNGQSQLQINLNPEVAQGVYANLALLTHSQSEFIIDMASMLPGMQKPEVRSRIIMVPEHAKRLLLALQDNIRKYEQQFGTINLNDPHSGPRPGSTIAPFNINPGQA